ncbi:MAG: hypothetical protein Q8M15_15105 [Bacteroidota bacterium]|nr:hypothetical protein [Bacteroidota bacterium]
MKLAVIKELAENRTLSELKSLEEKLCNGEPVQLEVKGDDEGEQLTHVLAAIDILKRVENENVDLRTAIRAYSERVRNSIS